MQRVANLHVKAIESHGDYCWTVFDSQSAIETTYVGGALDSDLERAAEIAASLITADLSLRVEVIHDLDYTTAPHGKYLSDGLAELFQ